MNKASFPEASERNYSSLWPKYNIWNGILLDNGAAIISVPGGCHVNGSCHIPRCHNISCRFRGTKTVSQTCFAMLKTRVREVRAFSRLDKLIAFCPRSRRNGENSKEQTQNNRTVFQTQPGNVLLTFRGRLYKSRVILLPKPIGLISEKTKQIDSLYRYSGAAR